jgi:CheY-like chemotaxis protein
MEKTRVLVIDDDASFARLVGMGLARAGFQVIEETDPYQGVACARSERPDVIILDLYMPKLDGYEVSKLLDADEATRDIPLVILTSAEAEQHRRISRQWGADAFVRKRSLELSRFLAEGSAADSVPVARKDTLDIEELRRAIEKVLAGH